MAPVLTAAPMPAITPQPSRPATSAGAFSSTLVHWPSWTRVFSAKEPIPSAAVSSVPSLSVIDLEALWVSKQYWRSEEHTSELQSRGHLVCRLLLEKKIKYSFLVL